MKKLIYTDSLLGTMPDTKLAKQTNKSINWIWRRRQKLKIAKFVSASQPKFSYNVKAFDVIDNISAYWLGYYFSDGNICKVKNRYLVSVGSIDKDQIIKLSNFYGLENCNLIYERKRARNFYALQLCNKHLYEKLNALGCVPKKSKILKAPEIPPEFYSCFLAGLFDGDGSISVNQSINQWKISIGTASKDFAFWLLEQTKFFLSKLEIRQIKNGAFYNVVFIGLAAKCFLSEIYSTLPDDLPMQRKKQKLSQIKLCKKGPNFQDWEIEILKTNDNLSLCQILIEADKRNFGWKRSIGTIRHKKLSLKRK